MAGRDGCVVHTDDGKTEFGNAQYIADNFTDMELSYCYEGYDAVDALLRYPEHVNIKEYKEAYRKKLQLLTKFKKRSFRG